MEPLLHNLIKAVGWSIIHSLWQGAIIYSLLMVSQTGIKTFSSKSRYIFAYGAACLMFACFVGTFIVSFKMPDAEAVISANSFAAHSTVNEIPTLAQKLTQYAEMLFPYLVCMYGIGIILQSVVVLNGYKKISELKKSLHQEVPQQWNILFESLKSKLAIKKSVTFWLSENVQVPLIIGYIKPIILFPVALANQMDINQVEAILIHELSHIRRNDYLFNLIRTFIDTVLFFNPFIWLTGKFIDIEREHACDDMVVRITQTPMTYAHALLKLELLTNQNSPALALAATGKKQYLYQRIKRITDMKTNYMNSKQKLFAITLTIATVISLAWVSPTKNDVVKKNHPTEPKKAKTRLSANPTSLLSLNAAICIDTLPQDTTKKKLKKTIAITTKNNRDTIYLKNVDSLISINVNDVINKVIRQVHIDMDSLPKINMNLNDIGQTISINGIGEVHNLSDAEKVEIKKNASEAMARVAEIQKTFNSPEQIARIKKMAMDHQNKYDRAIEWSTGTSMKMGSGKSMSIKSVGPVPILSFNDISKAREVLHTKEYQDLKKKFDQDVQTLIDKKKNKE